MGDKERRFAIWYTHTHTHIHTHGFFMKAYAWALDDLENSSIVAISDFSGKHEWLDLRTCFPVDKLLYWWTTRAIDACCGVVSILYV